VSRENVEGVRSIYALWIKGESARHLIDPDLEYVNPPYAENAEIASSIPTAGVTRARSRCCCQASACRLVLAAQIAAAALRIATISAAAATLCEGSRYHSVATCGRFER
jgi:hypothetical protein